MIADIHYQEYGYFVLFVIGNVGYNFLPNPSVVSDLQNLNVSVQQVQNLYNRVRSEMIPKSN